MMQLRNARTRRGDRIVHLNQRTMGIVVSTAIGFLLIAFAIGVGTGWAFFGRSVMEVEIRSDDAAPLASLPEPTRMTSHDAVAAETASSAATTPPATTPAPLRPTPAVTTPAPAARPPTATPPAPAERPAAETSPPTTRFAIVANSIAVGDTPTATRAEAEKILARLKTRGFRQARIEEVTVRDRKFFRIIAMEANYHTAAAARRDIEAMISRDDLTQGFPLLIGEAR
jgi:cell division septation protein DedD